MSLFGDESAAVATNSSKSRLSLFDDEPSPAPGSRSSLFADDDTAPASSPWGMPASKKSSRGDLLRNLLPASDVPDSYIDTFDSILKDGNSSRSKISVQDIDMVLSVAGVNPDQTSKIMSIVAPGGPTDLGRNEFNVLLALVGLAQEHEDITLDGVDERRRSICLYSY